MSLSDHNIANQPVNSGVGISRGPRLDIDVQQITEDEQYDELLDDLLSDNVDPTPKVELLDLDMEPSPTFQSFWASADDDQDEDYYPQEDIANLSKLIDKLEVQGNDGDYQAEHTMAPMLQYYHNNANASKKTTMNPTASPLNTKSPLVLAPKAASDANADNYGRVPFGVLENSPDGNVRRRRLSTGCIADSSSTSQPSKAVIVKKTEETETNAENEERLETSLDDILDIQLTFTASTTGTQSTLEDNMDSLQGGALNDSLEIQRLATASSEGSSFPSEPETISDKNSQELDKSVNRAKSISTKGSSSICGKIQNNTITDGAEEVPCTSTDPYEWAYNVWKKKGLMAGTPTEKKRPSNFSPASLEIETTPSTESLQSKASKGSKPKGEVASLRKPKDRQSLPAKISQHPHYQPVKAKARNGAGFSILLSRWKDKSDGNPNAHFLSPRELSPVRSPRVKSRELSPVRSPKVTSSIKAINPPEPSLLPVASKGNNGARKFDRSINVSAAIDTTPILSPSKRREKMRIEREEASKFVAPKDVFADNKGITTKAVAAHTPAAIVAPLVMPPSTRRKSLDSSDAKQSQPQLQKMVPREGQYPTPAKNKNALARFLQRTQPTPTHTIPVQSFGEKSREVYTKHQAAAKTNGPMDSQGRSHPVLEITPVSIRRVFDGSRRHSVSPTSTVPSFLSPGDDTLLEPRDVMKHRRQRSDFTAGSKSTTRTPMSHSVPCQEIFVMKDDQESIGLRSDDMRSMAGESDFNHSIYSNTERMHFTNLHDILETKRADSMSFDSQSEITHITFRTETLQKLDNKVSELTKPTMAVPNRVGQKSLGICKEEEEEINETPTREDMVLEMGEMIGVTPDYSERPWRKDLLVRNVTTAMAKASGSKFECDCEYSLAMFSEKDEMVDFFLPLMAVTCSCRKSKQLVNPKDPNSLENVLRPWQIKFLKAFGIVQGDQLVKAHHRSARSLAKSLYNWRETQEMTTFRVGSCGMALQIWSNTCKAYVRSVRKQIARGANPIERPNTLSVLSTFLDKMPSQMHQSLPQRHASTAGKKVPDESLEEI